MNRMDLNMNRQPSYFMGAVGGAIGGVAMTGVYEYLNPLGEFADIATLIIKREIVSTPEKLLIGAIIGTLAALVSTAVDRHFKSQNGFVKLSGDVLAGCIAAQALSIGERSSFIFGPIAIAGAITARAVNS